MRVRRTVTTLAVSILVALAVAACTSSPPASSTASHTTAATTSSASARAKAKAASGGSDSAPAAITWRASCMLSTQEVASAMSSIGWTPTAAPVADDQWAGDTMCDYDENAPDSTEEIDVDFRAYDPTSTYGFVSPDVHQTGFTAPSPAAAASSACSVATSGGSSDDGTSAADLCGTSSGVPYVVAPGGLGAVAFPNGTDFYVVQALGLDGTDDLQAAVTTLIKLVAGRHLVGVSTASPSTSSGTLPAGRQSACPEKLKSDFGSEGPYQEMSASTIDKALGATLPGDISCIILRPGDTSGEAYVHVFWARKDQRFANQVGQSLVADGMRAVGSPVDYQKNGADLTLYSYPSGDDEHWSGDFPGSPALVVGEGDIPDAGYFDGE